MNCQMQLQEILFEDNLMTLSVRLKCDYNVSVRSPKLSIFLDNGTETRRFPFPMQAYFPEENLQTCVMFANYTFNLDFLFSKDADNSSFSMRFLLTYGEEEVDGVPYKVSSDVPNEHPQYRYQFENNTVCIQKIKKREDLRNNSPFKRVLKGIILVVHHILQYLLMILLLPWFLVDAVCAYFGAVPSHQKVIEAPSIGIWLVVHMKYSLQYFLKKDFGREGIHTALNGLYHLFFLFPVKKNRITFLSSRRNDLSGNLQFVYDLLKDDPRYEFRFLLDGDSMAHMKPGVIFRFAYLYATSKVVLVDDFFRLLNYVDKRSDVKLIQLWHACGAFKTFGFSRVGKTGGPKQDEANHRQYDYAIVSSKEIAKFYAEGFGISEEKVLSTGVPRTDIFMQSTYRDRVVEEFYQKYPQLKGKKIMLFAPTFRGNGQRTAYYPTSRLDLGKMYEQLDGEYAILVKLHPFCPEKFEIPEAYQDYVLDFSNESELNDLLFVTDLLVTDYSSAVFEASLLEVPMVFYAFDLREYITSRDFYYEYETFVPGKIVMTEQKLVQAIQSKDFETEKIVPFRNRFFDELDGNSAVRVANFVKELLGKSKER